MIAQAEVALLEVRELANNGPRFRIVHRFHKVGTGCLSGEEVFAVFLLERANELLVPLPLSSRLVFNYLAEWRRVAQGATQIASGIHASAFYGRHGINGGKLLLRRISRYAVKEHIKRIRKALGVTFAAGGLSIDPKRVLSSESTIGNEVLYRLRATIEWIHLDN